MADPPRHFSPVLTRRRLLTTLGGSLLGGVLLGWPLTRLSAGLDHDQLRRSMRETYGERGLAVLEEWLALLDRLDGSDTDTRLRAVNDFFNRRVRWLDDIDIWDQKDYWATPLETLARGEGDCEDYTIGKYATLRQIGVDERRLRLIYVRARLGRGQTTQAHMVLGYYATPGAEPLILDNMQPSIVPAGQRTDLDPLFSFNGSGLWARGSSQSRADPVDRLSRWRNVIERMRQQGFTLGR
ncbi:transglutaminase-like cysteine peptidase [Halomonas sp. I1]|uniref:transglutaminase-like cysteine peptidase n=1 Tax=Halomonas sp. I1 TaxID=393536 RepID=UPI0028DF8C60|nr:transglutaminase-like cysteine peptidase [Halomonas sp. I1]MDT8893616.1 transglutaminase-like cysteine peptidase [Halomonas sp. I1]